MYIKSSGFYMKLRTFVTASASINFLLHGSMIPYNSAINLIIAYYFLYFIFIFIP